MVPLHDRVDLWATAPGELDPYTGEPGPSSWEKYAANVPAHVGYSTVERNELSDRTTYTDQLRAIIEPQTKMPQRITWRGTDYDVDGTPMLRRLYGRDHHLTIPLKRAMG